MITFKKDGWVEQIITFKTIFGSIPLDDKQDGCEVLRIKNGTL